MLGSLGLKSSIDGQPNPMIPSDCRNSSAKMLYLLGSGKLPEISLERGFSLGKTLRGLKVYSLT